MNCIESDEWLLKPASLNTFLLTAYVDLKKYAYEYWNCVPALLYPSGIKLLDEPKKVPTELKVLLSECVASRNYEPFLLLDETPTSLSHLRSVKFDQAKNIRQPCSRTRDGL
ncbi:unnamed protein product [Gongylonema pulchrum]|uniref:ATG7_N domain-containing protein n=1 Tax=Gongylonema pulchrum TaxID=637853 RepID=A0A183EZB7_9BILA|nr:unnamed protein product [Gongylonema pulchrum]